jgi:hypothetical protein
MLHDRSRNDHNPPIVVHDDALPLHTASLACLSQTQAAFRPTERHCDTRKASGRDASAG